MARVQLTREATRHFDTLPPRLQGPVLNSLTDLEIDPHVAGKPLFGRLKGLWSARIGNYRLIYYIEGRKRSPQVIVRAIQHLASVYEHRRRR